MPSCSPVTIAIIIFLSIFSVWCITAVAAEGTTPATDQDADSGVIESGHRTIYERSDRAIADAPEDPANLLEQGEQRRKQRDALIDYTLFDRTRTAFQRGTEALYDATSLKLGIISDNLFQTISDGFPDTDRTGVSSILAIIGTWELVKKGTPSQGQLFAHVEGRWDYGTTPPSTLGDVSLGTLIRTADPFNSYSPTFLLRNGYWQQGSQTAGWIYRLGKITPDQTLGTSFHLNPFSTFLPSGSVGMNAPLPDSGLGTIGIKYFDDRAYILGLISDANGDRYNWGDISEGDFFKAIEFGYKIRPMTDKAGYSKLTFTHTDGTADGQPKNVQLGPPGWSVAVKIEQELSVDGRWIGILKYGRTFDASGLYKHLASGHLLLYDPKISLVSKIANDVVGAGLVWADSWLPNTQEETAVEVFYRLPLFYQLDLTLSYQSFFNPARNPDVDQASVFGIRARTTF
jgi:hypothetical protein